MQAPPEPKEKNRSNLFFLGLSQAVRLLAGLGINVMLMRWLGVEGYGIYGYVATLVGVFAFGADLGMSNLLKRELAREPERTRAWITGGLLATCLLSCLTGLAIVAWATLLDGRPVVVAASAVAAVALGLRAIAMVPVSAFHAMRRMGLGVSGHLVGRVVLVVVTAALLYNQLGVVAVFIAQVADALVTLVIIAWIYRREVGSLSLPEGLPEIRPIIKQSVPFGLNSLFGSIYLSIDIILLAMMKGDFEVGVYRGAVTLIALFPVIADTLSTGLYPRMSQHLGNREAAGAELRFASRVLLAVSVPAAVGGILLAEPLMVFMGGEEFSSSALPFIVLAPLLPLRFLKNGFGMTLSTLNKQGERTRAAFFAAIINLVTNLIAIPLWGAVGAAATTLLTDILLTAWLRWRIDPLVVRLGLVESLVRTSLPAVLMGVVLVLLPDMQVLLKVAIGAAVYAVAGLGTGAWHPRDISQLRKV